MLWICTDCKWIGDDLVPTTVPAGIQGKVKTFACPKCGKTVGGGVVMYEPEPEPRPEPEPEKVTPSLEEGTVSPAGDHAVEDPAPVKTSEPALKPKRSFAK